MVGHMGWVVWHEIDAEVLWCVGAPSVLPARLGLENGHTARLLEA